MSDFIGILLLSRAARKFCIGSRRRCFGLRFDAAEKRGRIDFVTAMWTFHPSNLATVGYDSRSFSKEATTGFYDGGLFHAFFTACARKPPGAVGVRGGLT